MTGRTIYHGFTKLTSNLQCVSSGQVNNYHAPQFFILGFTQIKRNCIVNTTKNQDR